MINRNLDFSKPLRYVRYARMSTEQQNPESPEQQFDEIDRTRLRLGFHQWVHVRDFRDDGMSGRYMKKRPGVSQLLNEVETDLLRIDAILVDTLERFGRVSQLTAIRHNLWKRHAVVILTADSNFSDPTSNVGEMYGAMEAMRANSANAQKAHDVLRGKIKTAENKRWPGAEPPCGYKLAARSESLTRRNGKTVDRLHHVLVPDPATMGIPQRIFQLAFELGWGRVRIANHLNAAPEFVARHGKISQSTVGQIMTSTIYKGLLRFNKLATDVVDERRITQKNEQSEIIEVPDFCDALVAADIVDKVIADVEKRGSRIRLLRDQKVACDGKQIKPVVCGLVLKYPLSGLVRCGDCGAAMRPAKSGTKSKTQGTYIYYKCPCAIDSRCRNKSYVRGDWLWDVVIARLRQQLFPLPIDPQRAPDWLVQLLAEIQSDLVHRLKPNEDSTAILQRELQELTTKNSGWLESLSDPHIPPSVRQVVYQQYAKSLERKGEIERALEESANLERRVDVLLDVDAAILRLQRLEQVLDQGNPSDTNVELSFHIDSIDVFADGNVVLRTNRLGVFNGVTELIAGWLTAEESVEQQSPPVPDGFQVTPRLLSRRRTTVGQVASPSVDLAGLIAMPVRLPDKWVDESRYCMPKLSSWSTDNAQDVLRYQQEHPELSLNKIAKHYKKSRPTIKTALDIALERRAPLPPRKRNYDPPKCQDAREVANEVGRLYDEEKFTLKAIAKSLQVTRNTASRALDIYYEQHGKVRPDGRSQRKGRRTSCAS